MKTSVSTIFDKYIYSNKFYTIKDQDIIKSLCEQIKPFTVRGKKEVYYNIPCSFDIETTSFFEDEFGILDPVEWAEKDIKFRGQYQKKAIMYIWMFGICGLCIIGRTWDEWLELLDMLKEYLELSDEKHLICYIHNISYEFQFIKKLIKWKHIFATKPYEPLYAESEHGIIFKCSYRLTGKGLEKLGESLLKYKIKKMAGDLDYNQLRNSATVLTDKEIGYCINDIKVVMCHIMEQIQAEKKITKLPFTKTGYVRRDLQEECFIGKDKKETGKKRSRYRDVQRNCVLTPQVYRLANDAFQGGFTHAGCLWCDEIVHNVESEDITSAYPAAIIAEYYPMSLFKKRKLLNTEQLQTFLKYYCCMFTITFENIKFTFEYDNYISFSRCLECDKHAVLNNGRVKEAAHLTISITEIDFDIIKKWYTWEKATIHEFYTAMRGYLPTPIIKATIKYYQGKTTLKGVEGKEFEYLLLKELLNSIYGCMVTSIYHPDIKLKDNGEWEIIDDPESLPKTIDEYNMKYNRCLYYPWGIYITAHVRRRICLDIIDNIGESYVYSDTDSVKFKDPDTFRPLFDYANDIYYKKLCKAMKYHKLDPDLLSPATQDGKTKTLGLFECDGRYEVFKSQGAKRYMYKDNKGYHITIAGLPKEDGCKYLYETYGDNMMEVFKDGMKIPALKSGKLTHTYCESEIEGDLYDYQGNKAHYHELSYVNLAPCEFSMSITEDYIDFIQALKTVNNKVQHLKYT